jgi:hypothetical protein
MPKKSTSKTLSAPAVDPVASGSAKAVKRIEKRLTDVFRQELKSMMDGYPNVIADACRQDLAEALEEIYLNQNGNAACLMLGEFGGDSWRDLSDVVDDWIDLHLTRAIHPLNPDDWEYIDSIVADFERQASKLREARNRLNDQV